MLNPHLREELSKLTPKHSSHIITKMKTGAETKVRVGLGFDLFPGYSRARGVVSEIVPPAVEGGEASVRLSFKGIEADSIYHLRRSDVLGKDGQVLFDASLDFVREAVEKSRRLDWE